MTGQNGAVYLRAFCDMITKVVELMPFAPAGYAVYATVIIAKPLALVNAGFSLELSTPPFEPPTTLPPKLDPNPPTEADLLFAYKFPIKIGDRDHPYDGMLGYFDTDNSTTGSSNFTMLHIYFTAAPVTPSPQDPRILIQPENFPALSPYYIDPDGPLKKGSLLASHAAEFLVKTLHIDPYTPMHVYSPILPITALQLPACGAGWLVEDE